MCYKTIDNNVLKKKNLWEELNPEYEIIVYDDNMCRDFLKKEYSDLHVNLFDFLKDGPIKSDFWRVCILNKYGGIGSNPSFGAMKSLSDWQDRFATFWSLLPHPSVVQVEGLSPERPKGLLATTKQIFLNMDDVDAIQAYVDTVPVKDLGGGVNYR